MRTARFWAARALWRAASGVLLVERGLLAAGLMGPRGAARLWASAEFLERLAWRLGYRID